MSEPDYIVIRPAADLPPGFLPARLDGLWFDLGDKRCSVAVGRSRVLMGLVVAIPVGRFEVRHDDGVVAEIWEVRP